jgi:hypothetical protein
MKYLKGTDPARPRRPRRPRKTPQDPASNPQARPRKPRCESRRAPSVNSPLNRFRKRSCNTLSGAKLNTQALSFASLFDLKRCFYNLRGFFFVKFFGLFAGQPTEYIYSQLSIVVFLQPLRPHPVRFSHYHDTPLPIFHGN